ncbi:hypothetical protein B7463_g6025, partial [Scytalidium lignicola]
MTSNEVVQPPYPLYSTTFTIHRISPLYVGSGTVLDNESLAQYARHFRDLLAGDVLRGVRVGLAPDDDTLSRVGSLGTVTWRILGEEEEWEARGDDTQVDLDDSTMNPTGRRGILVKVHYEKAEYTAILLRAVDEGDSDESILETEGEGEFELFPLLLTRMPNSLRDTFTGFLASTFDTRVSSLHLGGAYLVDAFEKYISDLLTTEDGRVLDRTDGDSLSKKVIRDVQLLVGFDLPSGMMSLKTMDIHIAGEDVPGMLSRGGKGNNHGSDTPFMNALTAYIGAHLAMNLKHDRVKLLRIACAAFVLGSEGKVKLSRPVSEDEDGQRRATRLLVAGLIKHAKGRGLLKQPAKVD